MPQVCCSLQCEARSNGVFRNAQSLTQKYTFVDMAVRIAESSAFIEQLKRILQLLFSARVRQQHGKPIFCGGKIKSSRTLKVLAGKFVVLGSAPMAICVHHGHVVESIRVVLSSCSFEPAYLDSILR